MDFDTLIASITPETYQNLLRALETGRWPDGNRLSEQQREDCMRAVIAWGERYLPETARVGYIDRGEKAEGEVCDSHEHEAPVRFIESPTRH